jgi:TATA-binding protein-associated factor Taf7
MNTNKRNGNSWTVNELLSLQREYELLEWNIQQIAEKHQRTERAILFRLESEGIITSWNAARGFDMESYKASIEEDVVTEDCNEESCVDDDDEVEDQECCDNDSEYVADQEDEDEEEEEEEEEEDDVSEVEKLSERVWSLETTVTDIKDMVQHLFNNLVSSKQKKCNPLRNPVAEQH